MSTVGSGDRPSLATLRGAVIAALTQLQVHAHTTALIGSQARAIVGSLGPPSGTLPSANPETVALVPPRPESDLDILVLVCPTCQAEERDLPRLEEQLNASLNSLWPRAGRPLIDVKIRDATALRPGAWTLQAAGHTPSCPHAGSVQTRRSRRRGSYRADELAAMSQALRNCVLTVPYDSAAPVLATQPARRIELISGNCLHQAARLSQWIRDLFPDGEVSYFRDGRHHAVLFRSEGREWIYLDPYLMQLEAVVLQPRRPFVTAHAAPAVNSRLGSLAVRFDGKRLEVSKRIARAGGEPYVTHTFKGNLPDSVVEQLPAPGDRDIAFHPEVTTLSLRVVTPGLQVMSLVHSLVERRDYALDPAFRRQSPEAAEFRDVVNSIAALVGRSSKRLREYIAVAASIYDEETEGSGIEYVFPNAINGGDPAPNADRQWKSPG